MARSSSLATCTLLVLLSACCCAGNVAPPWPATWQLNLSTIIMPANYSGFMEPAQTAPWGIVSFDWSNAKAHWIAPPAGQPMTCEEDLFEQVQRSSQAALNKGSRFWVYRNSIKALPWFASVRKTLEDPAYAPWFLKFGPPTVNGSTWHCRYGGNCQCDTNFHPPKCSSLYHDQTQTPHYPAVINVDGLCPSTGCDDSSTP